MPNIIKLYKTLSRQIQRLDPSVAIWAWPLRVSSVNVYLPFRVQVWGLHVKREGGDKKRGRGDRGGVNQERGGSAEGFQRGDVF
jgi:hypothetical protein